MNIFVKIICNGHMAPGKLADAELHFTEASVPGLPRKEGVRGRGFLRREGFTAKEQVMDGQAGADEVFLTVAEVAERLKINEETVRRIFLKEPGVLVICFPRRGRRVYRTLRIPESVL